MRKAIAITIEVATWIVLFCVAEKDMSNIEWARYMIGAVLGTLFAIFVYHGGLTESQKRSIRRGAKMWGVIFEWIRQPQLRR